MSNKESKRLFVALPVDRAVRQFLINEKNRISPQLPSQQVRWVTENNYHLTLRFLGSTPLNQLSNIEQNLKRICSTHSLLSSTLTSLRFFPSKNKPKIIASLVQPNKRLEDLVISINESLNVFDIKNDTRNFRAHITVARCHNPTRSNIEFSSAEQTYVMAVNKVALYESQSKPNGVVYTVLNSWPLIK